MSKTIIAIQNGVKTPVLFGLTPFEANRTRLNLMSAEENFDMLGNPVCNYRIKTIN